MKCLNSASDCWNVLRDETSGILLINMFSWTVKEIMAWCCQYNTATNRHTWQILGEVFLEWWHKAGYLWCVLSCAWDVMRVLSAIIMTPTRELAIQITKDCKRFTKPLNLKVVCVYGGTGISEQIAELKRGAEIIVCTPGRMIDMLAANNGETSLLNMN